MTEEERTDELTQKAKKSYKIYSEDKCVDTYEGYQYIDGYCNGYEQGYEDCRHYAHNYYISEIKELKKENETLKKDLIILANPQKSLIVENVESIIAESQLGNCCIADRNENRKAGLNDEPPEIQGLIDSSAKFLAELIAKDEG